jgi:hypothetical protein
MRIGKSHLIADVERDEVAAALSAWRWFLGRDWSPLLVSAVGDVFLIDPSGKIARLDTGTACLERVAETRDEFEVALSDPGVMADWFLEPVVDELRAAGKCLGTGQCYGFTILPIFQEGEYGAANRFCLTAREHIKATGDLHLQLKEIPDGQGVQIRIVD